MIDPRSLPTPPYVGSRTHLLGPFENTKELVRLCREGRLYDVERWIAAGKPLFTPEDEQPKGRKPENALRVAIETKQHDLALLLLCNGFPSETERVSLLEEALRERAWSFVDLLLQWGADPLRVHPSTVLETYDAELFDRFRDAGLDFTKNHALAHELCERSSNRPAYGWARRHQEDPRIAKELAMALGEAVYQDRARAVALLLWAGADPHVRVPTLQLPQYEDDDDEENLSAIMAAVIFGHGQHLEKMRPDPARDDFEWLWAHASDGATVDELLAISRPSDWSATIIHAIHRMSWNFRDASALRRNIERMFREYGARLTTMSETECKDLRRAMLRSENDEDMRAVLRLLNRSEHCEQSIFAELVRTAAMQRRFIKGGEGRSK